ncbi:hypothetical protein ACJRO7_000743 [Eucalyptus globulus]|uniref:Uncharacterized protein n=1 Tax=Eucalyptus globulus TaxID=34317 RepID=A0ABD3LTY3_EUCGL
MGDFRAQWRLSWHNFPSEVAQAFLPGRRSGLLPKLRCLSWHNYPLKFDFTEFSLINLVFLDLSWSKLKESWNGWSHIKLSKNLKVLNLTGCTRLKKTPDLSANVKLERLILEKCSILEEIDRSIGQLPHLVLLNLNFCKKLRHLPKQFWDMESLELLIHETSIEEMPACQGDTGASSSMEQISRPDDVSSIRTGQFSFQQAKAKLLQRAAAKLHLQQMAISATS